jgi:hypothetical protein
MLIALAALLAGTSCSRPATPTDSVLAQKLAGRVAGPPQTCVTRFGEQNLHALDEGTLVYGDGETIYVNQLPPGSCPGIKPLNTLIVDGSGNQICRGDRVRALEIGAIIPGAPCNLGDWIPYRKP